VTARSLVAAEPSADRAPVARRPGSFLVSGQIVPGRVRDPIDLAAHRIQAWEDEQEDSQRETEDDEAPPEDPRY